MNKVLEYIKQHQEEMLEDLKTLVLAESPTHSKERVDQCGAEIQKLFTATGWPCLRCRPTGRG